MAEAQTPTPLPDPVGVPFGFKDKGDDLEKYQEFKSALLNYSSNSPIWTTFAGILQTDTICKCNYVSQFLDTLEEEVLI